MMAKGMWQVQCVRQCGYGMCEYRQESIQTCGVQEV